MGRLELSILKLVFVHGDVKPCIIQRAKFTGDQKYDLSPIPVFLSKLGFFAVPLGSLSKDLFLLHLKYHKKMLGG